MSAKVRGYKSPEALRHAIEHHLRSISPIEKKDVLRLRKHLAFERFLARMFDEKTCPMVLTGGYAMELRMDHARATKDIDLVLSSRKISRLDADEMHATVHDFLSYIALKDLGDFFSFEIREGKSELAGPPHGGFRFHIEAMLDNRQFAKFHIDIGASWGTVAPIENLTSKNLLSFAGIECSPFPSVSVEYQLADKLHAYTFVRKGRRGTRVKDLIDMVLIIQDKEVDKKKLLKLLKQTFRQWNTHPLPKKLPPPPDEWAETFTILAEDCELQMTIDSAFSLVSECYSQVMLQNT